MTFPRRICIFLILLLIPAQAGAFLLPPKKILEFVAKENSQHQGLAVTQTAAYYDVAFSGGKIQVPSRLYLKAPNKMRVESDFPGGSFIVILSGDSVLTLVGHTILQKNPPAITDEMIFRDLFLSASQRSLDALLRKAGIEPESARLTVNDRRLSYSIGKEGEKSDVPFLLVDKDLNVPLGVKGRDGPRVFEVRISGYAAFGGGLFYPDTVDFYDGGKKVLEYKAISVSSQPSLPESLFDTHALRQSAHGSESGEEPYKSLK